ncbi:MAG: hypothetical protein ACYDEV_00215 [Acidiferrobacter sp.]
MSQSFKPADAYKSVIKNPVPTGPNSVPYMTRRVRLFSTPAQRAYARAYDIHNTALYQAGVLLRIVGTDEQADKVEEGIDKRLDAMRADLDAEIKRLKQVRDDNGIDTEVSYTAPMDVEAHISTRRSAVYLGILEMWDTMIRLLDTLRLTGILTDKQFRTASNAWRKQILGVVIQNVQLANRAMMISRRDAEKRRTGHSPAVGEAQKGDMPTAEAVNNADATGSGAGVSEDLSQPAEAPAPAHSDELSAETGETSTAAASDTDGLMTDISEQDLAAIREMAGEEEGKTKRRRRAATSE